MLRVLCLGDIVGQPGRNVLTKFLPHLRSKYTIDLVIANGENSAGGIGITPAAANDLLKIGIDVITTGNHIWRHKECFPLLNSSERIIRPLNYPSHVPGKGYTIVSVNETLVAVINIIGRTFMQPVDCPFFAIENVLSQLPSDVRCIVVDFHAEATSEKKAMGHFLAGKVSAVVGTHTHVQTADAIVTSLGTATLSDLGMCGDEAGSVLGMEKELVISRFRDCLPKPFKPAKGEGTINGAIIDIERKTGKAKAISLVRQQSVSIFPVTD